MKKERQPDFEAWGLKPTAENAGKPSLREVLDEIKADPKRANSIQYILLHFLSQSLIKANMSDKEFLIWNFARGLPLPPNVRQVIEEYGKYRDAYFENQKVGTSESKKKVYASESGEFDPLNPSLDDAFKLIDSFRFPFGVRPSLAGMFRPQIASEPSQKKPPTHKMVKS